MGTTLTAAYVGPERGLLRARRRQPRLPLRDGELERITEDHSLVEELLRQGRSPRRRRRSIRSDRSSLARSVPSPTSTVDTFALDGVDGDVYLLCSDGLTSMVAESDGRAAACRTQEPRRRRQRALIAAALKAGGRDNITVVLFRVEDTDGVDAAPARPPRRSTREPSVEDQPTTVEQSLAGAAVADEMPAGGIAPETLRDGFYTRPPRATRRRRLAPRMPVEGSTRAARRSRRRVRRVGRLAAALAFAGAIAAALVLAAPGRLLHRHGPVWAGDGLQRPAVHASRRHASSTPSTSSPGSRPLSSGRTSATACSTTSCARSRARPIWSAAGARQDPG